MSERESESVCVRERVRRERDVDKGTVREREYYETLHH